MHDILVITPQSPKKSQGQVNNKDSYSYNYAYEYVYVYIDKSIVKYVRIVAILSCTLVTTHYNNVSPNQH